MGNGYRRPSTGSQKKPKSFVGEESRPRKKYKNQKI
jgi:hypothetical protein